MGGRGSSIGGSAKVYSDEQIVSEKRKNSGWNSKNKFVMSRFDADYTYKGFGSEQMLKATNTYTSFLGSHVSKDKNNAVVLVDSMQVMKTKYGYGVVVDDKHTVFVKDWQVWGRNAENKHVVINFNRQYYNVKEWGNYSESWRKKSNLKTFDDVVKLARKQEKEYSKAKKYDFTF